MFKSRIVIDLPSEETQRRRGPIEWVRSLFGAELDLRSGKEELTISAYSLLSGIFEAFAAEGVNDAVSLLVDKKAVYMDANELVDDLQFMSEAAQTSGVLDKKFREMHLVMTHRDSGLHTLVDVRIENQVILGAEEMEVVLSGRLEALRLIEGETAPNYAARIQGLVRDDAHIAGGRAALDTLTERLAAALRRTLVGARVRTEPAVVELIRPAEGQIAKFRNLGFGINSEDTRYRPVPTRHKRGAYADPFYYYYFDPYYDFMTFVILADMLHHHSLHTPDVRVVEPTGEVLYTGDQAGQTGAMWAHTDAVSYADDGSLDVADSIPVVAGSADVFADGAWGASDVDHGSVDWGFSDIHDSTGWGGSDVSSTSSCGSTCGWSSCGGCGGCGGCA